MKVSGYNAKCAAHIVYQSSNKAHNVIIKDRYDDQPTSVVAALSMEDRAVCVLNERGGIIAVNKALQECLELQGYEVPDEITIKSVE